MKGWGPMGRSLLFFLADIFAFWKLPNLGTVLHQCTAVGCLPGMFIFTDPSSPTLWFYYYYFLWAWVWTITIHMKSSSCFWSSLETKVWKPKIYLVLLVGLSEGKLWGQGKGWESRGQGKSKQKMPLDPRWLRGGWLLGWSADRESPPSSSPVYVPTGPLCKF